MLTGATLTLVSLLFTVVVGDGGLLPVDRLIPVSPPVSGRWIWSGVSQLGTGSVLYPLLSLVAVLRWRARAGRSWCWALLPLLALAAAQVLEGVLFVTLPRHSSASSAQSFSSGHTAAAALGWGLLCQEVRGRARGVQRITVVVAVAMGLLVGSSRVALAVHLPSDVLAALAFGVLCLCAVAAVDARWAPASVRPSYAASANGEPRSTGWWWAVPALAALLPIGLLLATPGPDRLKDLLVYQGAGGVAGAGQDVYGFRTVFDMPFTYPPFAALLSEPLSRMPIGLGQALWTVMSLAALVPLAQVGLRPVVRRLGLPLTVAALLLASPVRSHLRFGQVGIFLTLAVAVDLLGGDARGRAQGVGLGVATAVKLTPAVFLPWLVVTRSWSRLRHTLVWLVAASGLGLLLLWRSSVDYLGSASHDTTRFGANDIPGNQSVRGMLLRSDLPDRLVQPCWLAAVLVLVLLGTYGACRLEREGRRLAAVGVLAALSVAVSPISWVHHLVWLTLPLAALVEAGRWRTAVGWYLLLLPGLPALGNGITTPWLGPAVTDLQGLTAVAAVALLPLLCGRAPPVAAAPGQPGEQAHRTTRPPA